MSESNSPTQKTKRMVPLRYVLTPIAIIFLAIFVLIIAGALAPKPAKKPVTVRAPLVDVVSLSPTDVQFSISSQGSVMPRTATNLVSEVSGMVMSVSEKYVVGGFFKKGEELLQIDDITYQVAVLQAQSRLGAMESELVTAKARAKQAEDEWLLTGKPLSEAPILALKIPQLQKAEADLIAAQADLKEAQTKLARTSIVAPYDAMLKAKNVDVGQYVTIGTSLAETFAVDYAEVRLPIKQRDVAFLNLPKINQTIEKLSNVELFYQLEGQKFTWSSKISRYEGVVDTASRVHYIVAQLVDPYNVVEDDGNQNEIRIGTFVNANIGGKEISGITAIPRGAVHGANTLYLIDEEYKLHITDVDVLRSDIDYVYTQQAIDNDKRLILTNLETPVAGMTLRVNGEVEIEQETDEIVNQDEDATAGEDS
ncbi:efflux RND transporter periplasmic adaptor subunit [Thalassotalea sp. M1531]|uniref:Efflux RND transporter periplasmic adaptor subunit n=1 Tax=Thalassotalea algicola TaxID=2716224 RepID=A0A7Y0L8U6_9GAMM|nr:efflux RND transporter periplasmic adaptor subunit [Thalassotalea algicola]NMP30088.1 efflux RND transporter periplasmic adaptor subunit [Thalassotalea algicola]